jgi:hypothetical protein
MRTFAIPRKPSQNKVSSVCLSYAWTQCVRESIAHFLAYPVSQNIPSNIVRLTLTLAVQCPNIKLTLTSLNTFNGHHMLRL